MYQETKDAVRRTLRVCRLLWSLDQDDYDGLMRDTCELTLPDRNQVAVRLRERLKDEMISEEEFAQLVEGEILEEIKTMYSNAALERGLHADYGLAVLEYAAIMKDLGDDGYENTDT